MVINGDCREVMATLQPQSVDAVITDPPYELGFMGHGWDKSGIANDWRLWADVMRVMKPGAYLLAFSHSRTYHRMVCAIEDAGLEIRDCIMWINGHGFPKSPHAHLKPAFEPICVARKKPEGSINANAEKWGTGKYNIDACRIPYQSDADKWERSGQPGKDKFRGNCYRETLKDIDATSNGAGRFPANVIHDGIEESWARYFYCAKASPADRGEGNTHPTVKPTDLMRYLCKLVTPVGGTILDPFAGSGSTGKASALEGFEFVGIEKDPDYCKIAEGRVAGSKMELTTA